MATYTLTALETGFVGAAEVYKKMLLGWDLRSVGAEIRTNVTTPQALAKFNTDSGPQPYRKQDDFNGGTFTDRTLTAYQAKYDQELDSEDFRNTYLATLPQMPFEQYAVQQGGQRFLDSLMRDVLWLGVRNGSGTAAADICDGWGTIIAAEITGSAITPVTTGALSGSNAVTKVEEVYDASDVILKRMPSIMWCSYTVFRYYMQHYRTLNTYGFKPDATGKYILDGTQCELRPVAFMGTSGRLVMTLPNNFVFGTDTENLANYPTRHLNLLRNRILFPAGCQIKDIGAEVLVVNDQA